MARPRRRPSKKQRAKERRQAARANMTVEQWRNRDTGRRSTYDPFKHIAVKRNTPTTDDR